MAPSTQEVIPAGTGNASGDAPSTRRTDAVGLEVLVVVHASRYSGAARSATKQQPSVHEEARTVIVFPQGAVVRLTAAMNPGETVVLTNQETGADVLCRVANIKTQPGIQSYVELEFTQRAPGFWGNCFSGGSNHAQAPAARAAPATTALSAESVPAAQGQPPAEWREPVEAPVKASVAVPAPIVPAPVQIAARLPAPPVPVATAVLAGVAVSGPVLSAAPPTALQPMAPPAATGSSGFGMELETGLMQPGAGDEGRGAERSFKARMQSGEWSSGAKKRGLLIGIAAAAVLGLTVGGALLYRSGRATTAAVQTANAFTPSATAAVPADAPVRSTDSGAVTVSTQPALVSSEVSTVPDAVAPATGSSSGGATGTRARRPGIAVDRMSRPNFKGGAQVGSMEAPSVMSAEAIPLAIGSNMLTGRDPAASLAVASSASGGGRLEPPKLISSPAAIYPSLARSRNLEGVVVLDALVDSTGKVAQIQVLSGSTLLREAATDAVRSWKYQPGRLNGQPVAAHTQVNVDFHLTASTPSSNRAVTPPAPSAAIPAVATATRPPAAAAGTPEGGRFEAPKLISSPAPLYPALARANNTEGTVVIDALVDATGKVTQVKVVSGPAPLQQAAMETVPLWKYQPARLDGQPVAQRVQVSLNFRLH